MTFREKLNNKPSAAIFAMVEGLKTQSQRPDFIIDMDTYGGTNEDFSVCFGCAATCAVQQIAGVNIPPRDIVYKAFCLHEYDPTDTDMFELTIDRLRRGHYYPLFSYFDDIEIIAPDATLPHLFSASWQNCLQPYIDYANKLQNLGY